MATSLKIGIKKLNSQAQLPVYQSAQASGFDLQSCEDIVLKKGQHALIGTGLVFELPNGTELQIRPRSGLAYEHGITVLNSPGTVDSDYRGEVKILLINLGEEDFAIAKGERIAQGVLMQVGHAVLYEVMQTNTTTREEGGFGSTGK